MSHLLNIYFIHGTGRGKTALRHTLHKSDIVVFCSVSVFLQVRPYVLGHRREQIFDQVVGNKRVSEVKLGHVGLMMKSVY